MVAPNPNPFATAVAVAAALWVCGVMLFAGLASADISGRVLDAVDGSPIEGAQVGIRARPDLGVTWTDGDGRYHLPMSAAGKLEIGASLPYAADAERNYLTTAQQVFDGMENVLIELSRLPESDNPNYTPAIPVQSCRTCHGTYFNHWQASRHAGSAVNPWVLDLFSGSGTPGGSAGYVFRDSHDPDDTGFCATCHAPLEDIFNPGQVMLDEVTTPAGLDGVTCLACHQLAHVNDDIDALHHLGNSQYRFPLGTTDTSMYVWGTLPDVQQVPMQAVYSPLHAESKFCASCHQYTNPDTGAPGQNTYREWLASPYAQPGEGYRTCQNCHMPTQTTPAVVGGGGPLRPGSQRHAHTFVGATPQRLQENIHLRLQAEQQDARLVVTAEVENQCGHNFPTGISLRNALLVIEATLDGEPLALGSGGVLPFWASDDVPGEQPGDYAGLPGKGYAKVLRGRINGEGEPVMPVLFIDAEEVWQDNGIPSGTTDTSEYRFVLPVDVAAGSTVQVRARLLYRRAWRALAVTKGWTQTPGGMPVQIEIDAQEREVVLEAVNEVLFADGFEGIDPR